jgi:carotenoid cleavage dioxygenase-like enzyme
MSGYKHLRSLSNSTEKPIKAIVNGSIPKWLKGTLFRNGGGRYEFGGKHYNHLFDGKACVHKFKIEDGNVFYSNKLLETRHYVKSLQKNRLYPEFGTADADSNLFERLKAVFVTHDLYDNFNVNVVPYANEQIYALTESNLFCNLDPKDLKITNTIDVRKFQDNLRSTIAHPHLDFDGGWITAGQNMSSGKGFYEFLRYKVNGAEAASTQNLMSNAEIIALVPSSHKGASSYFHSFGLTENYIVFLEQPLVFSFKDLLKSIILNKPISMGMKMKKDFPTRIYLINRRTGEVVKQKFYTDPQFTFHHINAYEEPDPNNNNNVHVIIDICSYDSSKFDIHKLTCSVLSSDDVLGSDWFKATPRRIRVPLNASESNSGKDIYCEMKDINSSIAFEFPVINYSRYNGVKYKYVYGTNHFKSPFSVIKFNVEDSSDFKEMTYFEGENLLPCEPVFVENPNPTSEDDGVLLVITLTGKNDFLFVLDAKNLNEIARAVLPEDVKAAYTFHGFFADNRQFAKLNV